MTFDPHSILGVAPDAGASELKRSYRRQAMRWHPDRNTDPLATERFKQIRAAYEQLLAVDAEEVQEDEDEGPEAEQPVATRAADIRLNLHVTMAEAAFGCRKALEVTRGNACPRCAGTGEAGLSRTRFCEACHGSGRVRDAGQRPRPPGWRRVAAAFA